MDVNNIQGQSMTEQLRNMIMQKNREYFSGGFQTGILKKTIDIQKQMISELLRKNISPNLGKKIDIIT